MEFMKIYPHKSYEAYVKAQIKVNKQKLGWVNVRPRVITDLICKDYKKVADFIICHGTRNGKEQKWFKREFPEAYIIGTEISYTAKHFTMTIQHDFSEPKKQWIGKADIVYSNSFDHSFDPDKTIQTWRDQLKPDIGKIYLVFFGGFSI